MYNTVLLAVDFQPTGSYSAHDLAAREVAAALVRSTSHRLYVAGIYQYSTMDLRGFPLALVGPYREEQMYRTDTRMAQALDAYIMPLAAAGIAISTLWRVGPLRAAAVQAASDIRADLLIVGTANQRKRLRRTRHVLLRQLSQAAPCTVLVVSPRYQCDPGPPCVVPRESCASLASRSP